MTDPELLSWLLGTPALAIPLGFALFAVMAQRLDPRQRATAAIVTATVALATSVLVAAASFVVAPITGAPITEGLVVLDGALRLDPVTHVMLGLICLIAVIVTRFSRAYLHGDPVQPRYFRWLMATLSAVTLLVISNHLLVIAAAWVATSLSLHQLLSLYSDRTAALLAAHKKFLASRAADLCLLGGIALVAGQADSLRLDEVHAWARSLDGLPPAAELAAVLFVFGAALKCAQLPCHGWLLQVMEAPTPVSALLHAGVVNLGGFLLIRLAPLMVQAELAQTLLVMIGSVSAVVAALVMTTRVSVKVGLAWSTCAQMGLMLVQCGLGAYSLALLHLVAHSLYKAHAFLRSGSAVEEWSAQAQVRSGPPAPLEVWLGAATLSVAGVALIGAALGADPMREPGLWALALIVALGITPLVAWARGPGGAITAVIGATLWAGLYFGWHDLVGRLVVAPVEPVGASMLLRLAIVGVSFSTLWVLQAVLSAQPEGRVARTLYPPLFAGLYLDELFTRLTFKLWPPRLPPREPARSLVPVYRSLEA